MPKILYTFDFTPSAPIELKRFAFMLRKLYEQLARVFNGSIGFGDGTHSDNISGAWAAVADTGGANTNFTVTHNLGRLPVGYILMKADRAVSIYTGSVAATTTQLTLKANVANAAVSLFVL